MLFEARISRLKQVHGVQRTHDIASPHKNHGNWRCHPKCAFDIAQVHTGACVGWGRELVSSTERHGSEILYRCSMVACTTQFSPDICHRTPNPCFQGKSVASPCCLPVLNLYLCCHGHLFSIGLLLKVAQCGSPGDMISRDSCSAQSMSSCSSLLAGPSYSSSFHGTFFSV